MTCCTRTPVVPPTPLIQIRRGYSSACCDFRLVVETDAQGWKAGVRDRNDGRMLYSAYRCSLGAAKAAAVEFVVFLLAGVIGQQSPEAITGHLRWNEYW
jgi:hypothetical protein